jgi:phosphotransferase family enzyme
VNAVREDVLAALATYALPGAAELTDAVTELWASEGGGEGTVRLHRFNSRVFRLESERAGVPHTLILKRYDPPLARRNFLVARRWLPALDLPALAPRLLAVAAERGGEWVWHVYEDFGSCSLQDARTDRARVAVAIDGIAELHTRSAGHALQAEWRYYGGDRGIAYVQANVRDAIHGLELLSAPRVAVSPEQGALRDRLLARLHGLRNELPRRLALMADAGGPDVLLHGDLWPTNTFVTDTPQGMRPQLVDWDHVSAGPVSYDLSVFLYRFPREERPWIVDRYRSRLARAGWRLPALPELNVLFETAEAARYANRAVWPSVSLLVDHVDWAFDELARVMEWFEALRPAIPE